MCRSQEFADDNAPEPGHKSDPPLARRLDHLEQMMERLVEKIVPGETVAPGSPSIQPQQARRSLSASSHGDSSIGRKKSFVDVLCTTAASDGPISGLLAMRYESLQQREPIESGQSHAPTPTITSAEGSATPTIAAAVRPGQGDTARPVTSTGGALLPPLHRHFWVCNTLRAVVPPQAAIEAIIAASPAIPHIIAMCYSEAERREGRPQPPTSLSIALPLTSHPLCLAKRALQILICIQQLPPGFDWDALGTDRSMNDTMNRLSNTATLVTSNDELIGYAEGIECLTLQGLYQVNSGNLRKAWITARRALSLAQMVGLDRGRSVAFRSCDPAVDQARRTSASVLWLKVVRWERYLSLLLGIPIGSQGIDIPLTLDSSDPVDRLERDHAAISARISERNAEHHRNLTRHNSVYALTQEIDLDLEAAARAVPANWWIEPRLDPIATQESLRDSKAQLLAQIQHFTLVLWLHVPYMLHEICSPRYDYSKNACVDAARDLLSRFVTFRTHSLNAYDCHQVDYAGFIAAMTLCLSYLCKRLSEVWKTGRVRDDVLLIGAAKSRMKHIARVSDDPLNTEALGIIDQLSPIVERVTGDAGVSEQRGTMQEVQFNVPFMGAVHIKVPGGTAAASTKWQGDHRLHPSSAMVALAREPIISSTKQQRIPGNSFEDDIAEHSDAGFLQFTLYDDQAPLRGIDMVAVDQQPDFMADGEGWPLQGVDAAYWSLLDGDKT